MAASKHFERICVAAVVAALLICVVFMNGEALGISAQARTMGYEQRLFDNTRVHTIDIVIDDWEAFLSTAQSEEYSACSVVIDGEAYKNVGIRGKGNTSLSTVASMNSQRYSFKVEFDQYDSTQSYYGLDKLSLNNLIQDNTMMKDYLTYTMMNQFGVAAPLCSFVYITVNGEDWGLYLAAEAVEESFLLRNYGSDYGDLYKPDNMNMGGGRGNGKDFHFEDFAGEANQPATAAEMPGGNQPGGLGMGSGETKLQYTDDDPDSYSAIFSSAKTDVTEADQTRLIAALKDLSEGKVSAVDAEAVIRYFVVHNFVVNGDSYTGSMIHNYYLYEEDGQLSMIPWDYNLAFGTFQGNLASSAVNDDIDAPLSVTGTDRPMIDWIFSNEEYTQLYHQYFQEFLDTVDVQAIISQAQALIAPYVSKDPTKFCTYEEFEKGVQTLSAFCQLRAQSVSAQLAGEPANVDASTITLSDMGTMGGGFGGPEGNDPSSGGSENEESSSGGGEMPQMPSWSDPQQPGQAAGGTQQPLEGEGQPPSQPGDGNQQFPGFGGQGGAPQWPGQSGNGENSGETPQMPDFGGQGGMTPPDGMEFPGGENPFPGQNGENQGGIPSGGSQDNTPTGGAFSSGMWLLIISALVLAAGLVFAFLFKR